jgi:hypothetical protein
MKKNAALLAVIYALASGAMATESTKEKTENNNMEEVRVVGYDLSEMRGMLMIGLSGAYLIHEYDEKENVWRFVRTSNETKEE